MDGDVLVVVIVVAAALAAYAVVNVILLRIATHRRRMPETAWDADIPSLTIIVPCLDDGDRLDATIASLRDQTYADATILVVDGGSSDGSAAHAADLVAYDGQAISAGPAPDGWTVRRWIRRVGAETATTDLLLFVEPGTTLVPVAVRKIVEHGQRTGDALVSAVIGQAMPTWTEMAAIPGFTVFRSGFVPSFLTALTHGRPALIARWPGAVLLAGREAYLAAVTGTEDEPAPVDPTDDDIARAIVGTGGRIGIADGADVGQIRRERTYGAVLATWRRVLLPAVGGSLALAILAILAGDRGLRRALGAAVRGPVRWRRAEAPARVIRAALPAARVPHLDHADPAPVAADRADPPGHGGRRSGRPGGGDRRSRHGSPTRLTLPLSWPSPPAREPASLPSDP